jgi:hypothetical protein
MCGAQNCIVSKATNMSLRFEPLVFLFFFGSIFAKWKICFPNGEKLVFWEFFS